MKILNLVYPEKSDIKYTVSKFPDGQQQIVLGKVPQDHITIKSRLNSFMDLELIVCAKKALDRIVPCIHLYVPYFLGSRSDRLFEEGSTNYLRDVVCPIVNSLRFEDVTVVDPHSDVLEACLNNFRKETILALYSWASHDLGFHEAQDGTKNCALVVPDAGAAKKIQGLAFTTGHKGEIIMCSKVRRDGKIVETNIHISQDAQDSDRRRDLLIVDDICDGGATFIELAKVLKDRLVFNKIYLIVTHGIFSKGFSELEKHFDGIYCTNSYSDKSNWTFEFGDPSSIRQAKFVSDRVKQLNIF